MEWGGKWDNCNSIINKYIIKKKKFGKLKLLCHFLKIYSDNAYQNKCIIKVFKQQKLFHLSREEKPQSADLENEFITQL